MDNLKEQLGIDNDKPIPADYSIPYYVHQDEMNRMDQSHKRVEKGIITASLVIILILFGAFVGTNAYWVWNEHQYEDVVTTVTQETSSEGGGDAIINGDNAGAVFYGKSKTNSNN